MLQRSYFVVLSAIVLSLMLYFALPAGPSLKLKTFVTQLFSPLMHLSSGMYEWWDNSRQELQSRTSLLEENQQLRATVALQMQDHLRLTELDDENRRLRDMVGYRQSAGPQLKPAHIIGRDPSNWWKTIMLDVGTDQGVSNDCAVVTPRGLVGKTVAVGRTFARVLLIVDPNCKVSTIIQETRDPGIVEGVFEGLGGKPACRMDFVSRDAKVAPKQTVITSGLGGIFPKGLRIGEVEQISLAETGLYKSVRIKPSTDLERLEEVFVITH